MGADERDTVELIRLTDAVEAEMLRDFIRDEGLFCATPGMNHRAVLGMAGGYVDIVVRVRRAELEEARALLEAFRGGEIAPGEGFDDELEASAEAKEADKTDQPSSPRRPPTSPRLKRVAAFCALALPAGCGHFYARRYRQGFALLGGSILLFGFVTVGQLSIFAWLYPLLMLGDLLGAFVAVDEFNGVERQAPMDGLLRQLPYLLASLVLVGPLTFAARPTVFTPANATVLCASSARCSSYPIEACEEEMAEDVLKGRYESELVDGCAACLADQDETCEGAFRCAQSCGRFMVPPRPERAPARLPDLLGPGSFAPARSPDDLGW